MVEISNDQLSREHWCSFVGGLYMVLHSYILEQALKHHIFVSALETATGQRDIFNCSTGVIDGFKFECEFGRNLIDGYCKTNPSDRRD